MTNTIPNDTRELEIGELDCVSGGLIKGEVGVCTDDKPKEQSSALATFQQLVQSL